MGNQFDKFLFTHLWKEDEPYSYDRIKYDPQFGFEDRPRPLKEPGATVEELDSSGIPLDFRDACSKINVKWYGCMRNNPGLNLFVCEGLRREVAHCYYDEKIHDMKEFERERRLNKRERRLNSAK